MQTLETLASIFGIPEPPAHQVLRTYLVSTIEKMLTGGTNVVLVESEEGFGATTLLAQFARIKKDKTIVSFLQPASRLTYDPGFLRTAIATQILWLLERNELKAELVNEAEYRNLIYRLQRKAQRVGPFFFVLDGLSQIPQEDAGARDVILRELLPIGLQDFKFVISMQQSMYFRHASASSRVKTFPLSPFSPPETAEYLHDLNLSEVEIRECERLCKGVPARLASIRRLFDAGRSVNQIVAADPEELPDFLQIEWERHVGDVLSVREMLAVLAFGRRGFSTTELAAILGRDIHSIEKDVEQCRFLEPSVETGQVRFIAEMHRQFTAKKLAELKQVSINRIIDQVMQNPGQLDRATDLPVYLEQAQRFDEILEVFSEDHLSAVVAQTSSIAALQQDVKLAVRTASRLRNPVQIMKYAFLRSAITELLSLSPWLDEMEAQVALGNYGAALSIANNATTKEARLRLLAAYARLINERDIPLEISLKEQLVNLVEDIEGSAL